MIQGLVLLALVATIAYSLVDVVKSLVQKSFGYPLLTILFSVYNAVRLNVSIYKILGVTFFGSPLEAYIVTGLLASLGAKKIYDRFGGFIKNDRNVDVTNSDTDDIKRFKVGDPRVLGDKPKG